MKLVPAFVLLPVENNLGTGLFRTRWEATRGDNFVFPEGTSLEGWLASQGLEVVENQPLAVEETIDARTPPPSTVLEYERRGHACTRALFERSEVATWKARLSETAAFSEREATAHARRMNVGDEAPFLQTFNAHRFDATAMQIATCDRLVATATALLGVDAVVLYQTSLFLKRAGDLATNWHSDLATSPLDTNDMVTAWIPLHDVPDADDGGTGLLYADASHRDLALAYWYGGSATSDGRYVLSDHGFLNAGDVSWHAGWLLHSAAANLGPDDRLAFAVSFVSPDTTLVDHDAMAKVNDEDKPSYADWIHDLQPGDPLHHPLLPLLYAPGGAESSW